MSCDRQTYMQAGSSMQCTPLNVLNSHNGLSLVLMTYKQVHHAFGPHAYHRGYYDHSQSLAFFPISSIATGTVLGFNTHPRLDNTMHKDPHKVQHTHKSISSPMKPRHMHTRPSLPLSYIKGRPYENEINMATTHASI